MKRILLILSSLAFCLALAAQEKKTLNFSVYYTDNITECPADTLAAKLHFLPKNPVIDTISVTGHASPLGPYDKNVKLASQRAENLADSLRTFYPDAVCIVSSKGEDWETLSTLMETSSLPEQEELKGLLSMPRFVKNSKGTITDGRKHRFMNHNGGKTWSKLKKDFFPKLRRTDVEIRYHLPAAQKDTITFTPVLPEQDTTAVAEEQVQPADTVLVTGEPLGEETIQKKIILTPRTNMLVPAMNAGVVIPIGKHFSIEGDFYSPWPGYDEANSKCFQLQAANIQARWWINPKELNGYNGNTLTGHSITAGALAGHYDFERNYHGIQGELYGGYIGYAYTFRLADWLRLTLEADFGHVRLPWREYKVYTYGGKLFRTVPITENIKYWTGPVKAEVSLWFPITVKTEKKQ